MRHVSRRLTRYHDGQLEAAGARVVELHLASCARCRHELDEIRFAARLVQQLTLVPAPADVWTLIDGRLTALRPAPVVLWWRRAAATVALLVVAVAGVYWSWDGSPGPWAVSRGDGRATRMAEGEVIETTTETARITVGDIGTVDVAPATRVRLGVVGPQAYRLALASGTIHARISAPPRVFVVETPSSTLVDLGCAYTAQIDAAGAGELRVTEGWVSLEWDGRESLVPAGAMCRMRPGAGPGTPYFADAPDALRQAVAAFDAGDAGVLAMVLEAARTRDTLTLWHLLSRVDRPARARVFDRIARLAPPPPTVSRDQVLALDRAALTHWREELAWTW